MGAAGDTGGGGVNTTTSLPDADEGEVESDLGGEESSSNLKSDSLALVKDSSGLVPPDLVLD